MSERILIPAGASFQQHLMPRGVMQMQSTRPREVDAELHADGRWYFTSAGARYSIASDVAQLVEREPA